MHLHALREDDFLWAPAELNWSVHLDENGAWRPDWADTEPDPIPVPTIAWLTWQVSWWWSTALDDLSGLPHRRRADALWPGTGAEAGRTIADSVLWVNVELVKNISEIGQLRLLRAARSIDPGE